MKKFYIFKESFAVLKPEGHIMSSSPMKATSDYMMKRKSKVGLVMAMSASDYKAFMDSKYTG